MRKMDLPSASHMHPGGGVRRRMCVNGAREVSPWGVLECITSSGDKTGDGVSAWRQGLEPFLCLDAALTTLFYLSRVQLFVTP